MELWQRARNLATEAATKTNLSELVTKSKHFATDLATEASKKSLDFATEASKKSLEIATKSKEIAFEATDFVKSEASKQIKGINVILPNSDNNISDKNDEKEEFETFGVTEELREFVKGITVDTFRDFPIQDDSEVSDIPTVSNVRQDLTAWQEKHAKIVLSTVKEISKLRYELCPRAMKERKFWRIYFILVNSHVSPYEERYIKEAMLKSAEVEKEKAKEKDEKMKESSSKEILSTPEAVDVNQNNKTAAADHDQDLDVFLLGDLGESDEGPDNGDRDFDDL